MSLVGFEHCSSVPPTSHPGSKNRRAWVWHGETYRWREATVLDWGNSSFWDFSGQTFSGKLLRELSNEENPGCEGYIGDYTTQLYRDYTKAL